jgi:hypothetical protein
MIGNINKKGKPRAEGAVKPIRNWMTIGERTS